MGQKPSGSRRLEYFPTLVICVESAETLLNSLLLKTGYTANF